MSVVIAMIASKESIYLLELHFSDIKLWLWVRFKDLHLCKIIDYWQVYFFSFDCKCVITIILSHSSSYFIFVCFICFRKRLDNFTLVIELYFYIMLSLRCCKPKHPFALRHLLNQAVFYQLISLCFIRFLEIIVCQ